MKNSTTLSKSIKITLLTVGVFSIMEPVSLAKAAYQSKTQMITNSEYIAVVNVTAVHKVDRKGFNWTYSNEADASLEKSLKGKLPKSFKIYGGENFICAHVELGTGKYLVFLNRSGDLLIGSNWHLSVRPIKDGKIEWFDSEGISPLKFAAASTVISEIDKSLFDKKNFDALPPDLKKLATANALEDDTVGDAPGPSEIQKIFKALRAKPPKLEDLIIATKYGSPAGQMYAAILIYAHDAEKGKAALVNLSTCNATLNYKSGCMQITAGVWDVASKLYSDGKYMNLKLHS